MQLVIGNKNYSSWSLRPWIALTHAGVPFQEVKLRLDEGEDTPFKRRLAALGVPTARVPVLVDDDGFVVWDSLAIVETVAERFPDRGLWPAGARERARARSLAAEMHSGFGALRTHCCMNIEARLGDVGRRVLAEQAGVRQELARFDALVSEALAASGGPFLFGAFGIVDAFYTPVATRMRTYGLPLSPAAQGYVDRVLALPAFRAWEAEALAEHDFLPHDEPYRKAPV